MSASKRTGDARSDENLLQVERDVRARIGHRALEFDAMQAISNIYRAATAVRRRAEREVLGDAGLSWGGFTIVWVLWIWGEMETSRLASECGLAKGTLTGMLTTLEAQGLVSRTRPDADRRRMLVRLTPRGTRTISRLFTRFNAFESAMCEGLTGSEQRTLAALLRRIVDTADDGRASDPGDAR